MPPNKARGAHSTPSSAAELKEPPERQCSLFCATHRHTERRARTRRDTRNVRDVSAALSSLTLRWCLLRKTPVCHDVTRISAEAQSSLHQKNTCRHHLRLHRREAIASFRGPGGMESKRQRRDTLRGGFQSRCSPSAPRYSLHHASKHQPPAGGEPQSVLRSQISERLPGRAGLCLRRRLR